jgi:hypothetical protein
MNPAPSTSDHTHAPDSLRAAMLAMVDVGVRVGRLVGRVADAETALVDATAQLGVAEDASAIAESLAEAIAADQATAAAAEARRDVVARTAVMAEAYAQVSRGVRRCVLLVERMDRGWARYGAADDRDALTRRQVRRGVSDAIEREASGEQRDTLRDTLAERLDAMDRLDEIGDRPVDEIIAAICRDLGIAADRLRAAHQPVSRRVERDEGPFPGGGAEPRAGFTPLNARPPPDRTSPRR